MKISARNMLEGTVRAIHLGEVEAEVQLELQGGATIASVITRASAERLGLKVRDRAFAVVKASDVMVAVG